MSRLVVAVTGGIASGKSAVCALLAEQGIALVDADLVAREVVAPGTDAIREIESAFGPEMILPDGSLDRSRMRRFVFDQPARRRQLEAITHPGIRKRMAERVLESEGPYVLASIPLLAEGGGRAAYPWLQRIVVVDAPQQLQIARLRARDGIDVDLALRMLRAQSSRTERLAIASDVLINDADFKTLAAATARLHLRLLEFAAHDRGTASNQPRT